MILWLISIWCKMWNNVCVVLVYCYVGANRLFWREVFTLCKSSLLTHLVRLRQHCINNDTWQVILSIKYERWQKALNLAKYIMHSLVTVRMSIDVYTLTHVPCSYEQVKAFYKQIVEENNPLIKLALMILTWQIIINFVNPNTTWQIKEKKRQHLTMIQQIKLLLLQMVTTMMVTMTSSNGNIFCATGLLCGQFTVTGEFPSQRPVTRRFDVIFDLRRNKRLSKQSWGWWYETPSSS